MAHEVVERFVFDKSNLVFGGGPTRKEWEDSSQRKNALLQHEASAYFLVFSMSYAIMHGFFLTHSVRV